MFMEIYQLVQGNQLVQTKYTSKKVFLVHDIFPTLL